MREKEHCDEQYKPLAGQLADQPHKFGQKAEK
jgi:hypothetical protein